MTPGPEPKEDQAPVDVRPYVIKTYDRWIILVIVLVVGWFLFRPVFAWVCAYRGVTFEASMAPDAAEHYYLKATKIDAAVGDGWVHLGELYYFWNGGSRERYVEAQQAFAQGTQDVPGNARLPFDLGRTLLLKLGEPKQAEAALREAVRRDPNDEFAWDYLGYAALRSGDRTYAIQCWREVLKINPAHVSAREAIRQAGG
jgi:tetratricopeptide (TPR) repeat protein